MNNSCLFNDFSIPDIKLLQRLITFAVDNGFEDDCSEEEIKDISEIRNELTKALKGVE